jgi:alpha-galactosidase
VDQDTLGKRARRMVTDGDVTEMWVKELTDGSLAVGFFNRTGNTAKVDCDWHSLGYAAAPEVRDLWLRQDLGTQQDFAAEIPPHGCVLLKILRP